MGGCADKPRIPDDFEAAALARISVTIDAVFADKPLPYGHEDIYRVSRDV